MHKYLCLCGVSFKNKSDAHLHEKFNEPMNQDYIRHKIFKMKWKAQLASLLWEYPWHKTFITDCELHKLKCTHLWVRNKCFDCDAQKPCEHQNEAHTQINEIILR